MKFKLYYYKRAKESDQLSCYLKVIESFELLVSTTDGPIGVRSPQNMQKAAYRLTFSRQNKNEVTNGNPTHKTTLSFSFFFFDK